MLFHYPLKTNCFNNALTRNCFIHSPIHSNQPQKSCILSSKSCWIDRRVVQPFKSCCFVKLSKSVIFHLVITFSVLCSLITTIRLYVMLAVYGLYSTFTNMVCPPLALDWCSAPRIFSQQIAHHSPFPLLWSYVLLSLPTYNVPCLYLINCILSRASFSRRIIFIISQT